MPIFTPARIVIGVALAAYCAPLFAQTPTPNPTPTPQVLTIDSLRGASAPIKIRIEPGVTGSAIGNVLEDIPARACVVDSKGKNCFVAQDKDYAYGDGKASILEIGNGRSALLLLATFSGVSDSSTWIILFGLDSSGKLVNLLPNAGYTMQDSYRFWTDASMSDYRLLTLANFIWGENDGHFGRHRFDVTTFLFCPALGRYLQADTFKTRRFRENEDLHQAGETVLNAEMSVVKSHLAKNKAAGSLCPSSKP